MARRPAGFTLLELMVALAIFALLGVGAYQVLSGVLTARAREDVRQQDFRLLASTLRALEADLTQAIARGVRGNYGYAEPAFVGTDENLTLTRVGWSNPLGAKRSTLQRVSYRVGADPAPDGGANDLPRKGRADPPVLYLVRESWAVLDRAPTSTPLAVGLLPIVAARFRYLGNRGQWLEQWPAVGSTGGVLPLAVEVTLTTAALGEIRRLLVLRDAANSPPDPASESPDAGAGDSDADENEADDADAEEGEGEGEKDSPEDTPDATPQEAPEAADDAS